MALALPPAKWDIKGLPGRQQLSTELSSSSEPPQCQENPLVCPHGQSGVVQQCPETLRDKFVGAVMDVLKKCTPM